MTASPCNRGRWRCGCGHSPTPAHAQACLQHATDSQPLKALAPHGRLTEFVKRCCIDPKLQRCGDRSPLRVQDRSRPLAQRFARGEAAVAAEAAAVEIQPRRTTCGINRAQYRSQWVLINRHGQPPAQREACANGHRTESMRHEHHQVNGEPGGGTVGNCCLKTTSSTTITRSKAGSSSSARSCRPLQPQSPRCS